MAGRAFISRFSPNRTDPKVLEAIFVQRHKLAEVWLERLRDSVLTEVKHQMLAVGPRGCGKTHLVALLVGRLRKEPAVVERVRIAWLPEDETTPSFWKFLLRILRALNTEYGAEFSPPPHEELAGATDARRSGLLIDYLLNKLDGRTLLVVVENLDDVMRGLKDEGQKRWRAFLQEHPVAATLATAQQLTEDVSDRDRPFFNFFQIEHLQPLTSDEALVLLRKIAEHTGNADLSAFLTTPAGRARVRAIRHITGGGHRVFIILSEFVTRENLDDLVIAFEQLLDELTPYYQERLRSLPDQQREIVEFLCRQTNTVQVKEIAGALYLSEQSAAAQLKSLKDKGYVTAATVGRESRYELAEPLMRLCMEVKDPRGEPIRLIVEFLRIWYDRARVEARLQFLPAFAELEQRYLHAALQAYRPDVPGPVEAALERDIVAAIIAGDYKEIERIMVELAATGDTGMCFLVSLEFFLSGRYAESLIAADRAISLDPKNAGFWYVKWYPMHMLGRHMEALVLIERAIELCSTHCHSWIGKAQTLNALGRYSEALAASETAIEIDPKDVHAWEVRGRAELGMGLIGKAVQDFRHAMELNPNYAERLFDNLAEAHVMQGDWAEAEQALYKRFRLQDPWILPGPVRNHSPHLPDLIATIFRASTDSIVRAHRASRLSEIAQEAQEYLEQKKLAAPPSPLAILGDSLVRSLRNNAYTEAAPAPAALDAWAEVWRKVAERHTDLSLATRLFSVGVKYVQTKDDRALLDLVQEERAILRDLFGLDGDTEN